MTDLSIRRAVAEDGPACAAIVHGWLSGLDWMPKVPTLEFLETALSEGLPTREAYVIGDPVQGYLSFSPEESHINAIYVAARGQGAGRALMDHIKQGHTYLRLNTHTPNTRAHRFYEREGFDKTGERWLGEDGIDEIRMEWHRGGGA